jgi:hypothetical protein
VKPCKACALLELCTRAHGALSQSSSGVPFVVCHLRLALASGIHTLKGHHTTILILLVRRKLTSTLSAFVSSTDRAHQQPEAYPQDHEAGRHHADCLRNFLSLDCRVWNLVGLALQRQVVVFPARVIPYDSHRVGPSMLTVPQSGTCRPDAQANLSCPLTTIMHRLKADASRIRSWTILSDSLPGIAAHTCLRLHTRLAGCSMLLLDDDRP